MKAQEQLALAVESDPAAGAAAYLPHDLSLESLRKAAADCRGCDLWRIGTQTVFGEGRPRAKVMMVGEQPGDREDVEGRPFVGPAGRVLDEALDSAGLERSAVYLTNTVKHFRWKKSGKRRLHEKPNAAQVRACRPWLQAELAVIQPRVMVLLGATAAQSVMGPSFKVTQQRGQVLDSPLGVPVVATVHPSAILRSPDDQSRHEAMAAFVSDLKAVARFLKRVRAA